MEVWLSDAWYIRHDQEHLFKDWLGDFFRPQPAAVYDDLPSIDELNAQVPASFSNAVLDVEPPASLNFQPPPLVPSAPLVDEAALVERISNAVLAKLKANVYAPPRSQPFASGEMRSLGEVLGPVSRAVRRFGG